MKTKTIPTGKKLSLAEFIPNFCFISSVFYLRVIQTYLTQKNNTTQLYFIIRRAELCLNFSSVPKDGYDNERVAV